jgi:NADPH2:quinone reductase
MTDLPSSMLTGGRGADVVYDNVGEAVLAASLRALACHGRYGMNGFASEESRVGVPLVVPRSLAAGNFRLCGVRLACADPATGALFKRAVGWNFVPRAVGDRLHAELGEGLPLGKLRPVVGREVGFEALPAAMQALASREPVGRVIARVR